MNQTKLRNASRLIVLLLAICSVNSGRSAENSESFFRLSAGSAPGVDRAEFSGSGGTESVSLDSEVGFRLDALAVTRFPQERFDWVVAGGFLVSTHSGEDESGDEADLLAVAGLLQAGVGLRFGDNLTLEFTPEVAGGMARQDITGFSSGSGPYLLYGLRSGILYRVADHIELGLDLSYGGFVSLGEIRTIYGDADVDFTGDGPRLAGTLSVRF